MSIDFIAVFFALTKPPISYLVIQGPTLSIASAKDILFEISKKMRQNKYLF